MVSDYKTVAKSFEKKLPETEWENLQLAILGEFQCKEEEGQKLWLEIELPKRRQNERKTAGPQKLHKKKIVWMNYCKLFSTSQWQLWWMLFHRFHPDVEKKIQPSFAVGQGQWEIGLFQITKIERVSFSKNKCEDNWNTSSGPGKELNQ